MRSQARVGRAWAAAAQGGLRVPRSYTYFAIPFDRIPVDPPYQVWFTSWSEVQPPLGEDTALGPGANKPPPLPFVVGATTGSLPRGATVLGKGRLDRDRPPPPLPSPSEASAADYQEQMRTWVESGDGAEPCTCFTIPF